MNKKCLKTIINYMHLNFFLFCFINKNNYNLNMEFDQTGLYNNFIVQVNRRERP